MIFIILALDKYVQFAVFFNFYLIFNYLLIIDL